MISEGLTDQRFWPEPSSNPNLLGHEEAEALLLKEWRSGRFPHAWLLSGPRGIGKATLAYRFARYVLQGNDSGSLFIDPNSGVFQRIVAGSHSDFLAIQRGTDERGKKRAHIVVEDVRKINSLLSLTPGEAGWRVIIVDAAEELNHHSANALLKVLEEPPERALFLLVTHAPNQVLPTVTSRCRSLKLCRLPPDIIEQLMSEAAPNIPEYERSVLAHLADGSPGRLNGLLQQGGVSLYSNFIDLVQRLPEIDGPRLHELGDGLSSKDGVDRFRTLSDLILWWLGRCIRLCALGTLQEGGEIVPGEASAARLFDAGKLDQWVDVWEKLNRLFAQANGLNLDPKQVLVGAFTTLQEAARA